MRQRRESWNLRKTFSVQLFRFSAQLLANFSVNLPAPHLRLNGSIFPSWPTWLPRKLSCLRKKWANFAKCLFLMFIFAFLSSQEVSCEGSKIIKFRIMYHNTYTSNICVLRRWTVKAARQMCISSNCTRHGLCSAGSVQSVFPDDLFLNIIRFFHFNLRAGTVVFYHYFLPSYSVCYVFTSWPLTFTGLQRNWTSGLPFRWLVPFNI